MQSFCTSFSFTQSIESLLFIENVLQHDSSECGGTVVRVRKPKWIAIVCASIAAHLKYFIKRSLAAICCPFMRMRCQVFALRAIAYEMRTLAESQIFFISYVHSYNGFINKNNSACYMRQYNQIIRPRIFGRKCEYMRTPNLLCDLHSCASQLSCEFASHRFYSCIFDGISRIVNSPATESEQRIWRV